MLLFFCSSCLAVQNYLRDLSTQRNIVVCNNRPIVNWFVFCSTVVHVKKTLLSPTFLPELSCLLLLCISVPLVIEECCVALNVPLWWRSWCDSWYFIYQPHSCLKQYLWVLQKMGSSPAVRTCLLLLGFEHIYCYESTNFCFLSP